jgi:hypothetical protein
VRRLKLEAALIDSCHGVLQYYSRVLLHEDMKLAQTKATAILHALMATDFKLASIEYDESCKRIERLIESAK